MSYCSLSLPSASGNTAGVPSLRKVYSKEVLYCNPHHRASSKAVFQVEGKGFEKRNKILMQTKIILQNAEMVATHHQLSKAQGKYRGAGLTFTNTHRHEMSRDNQGDEAGTVSGTAAL